jgi:ABC-2 type transport system ATP-binding protein
MADAFAIEAFDIVKRFGTRDALSRVNLSVRTGRLHGLLGPNGAGKTTLMRVLLGLMRADEGTVQLLGRPVRFGEPVAVDVAGFVETPGFYPYLSGEENLDLLVRLDTKRALPPVVAGFSRPSFFSRSERRKRVRAALAQVGLDATDVPAGGYSAGMRQRLGLAAALLRSPRLLVLDEPTSSLDPAGTRDVRALMRQLAETGTTVVLSSHDMAEVEELCSDLTVIDGGRVVYAGTIDDLPKRAPAAAHALQTSDDAAAVEISRRHPAVRVRRAAAGGELVVAADAGALDAYVIALGQARVAVRLLERRVRSLESLFFDLTGRPGADETACEPADVIDEHAVCSEVLP